MLHLHWRNKMKKWKFYIIRLIVVFSLLIGETLAYAHPEASEHDSELEKVLFEEGFSKYKSNDVKNAIKALEYASYLTIDQFGGNGEFKFKELKRMNMGGLPWKFSTIDYNTFINHPDKKINANTHRMYTHQGWDRDYSSKSKEAEKFWTNRRKILLGTVNSVFNIDSVTLFRYSEKCNSLAGIIYYVHILGDYNEADKYTKIAFLPDLAERNNANADDKNYDVITSLKSYIEILFADQKSSTKYKTLLDGLDNIAVDAGKIVQSVGGVNTDGEFTDYHQYADDILELLIEYMPTLLKNEEFFAKVFYPDQSK